MIRKPFLLLLVLLALLVGCESRKEQKTETVPQSPKAPTSAAIADPEPLLKEPIEPSLFEYPTEALAVWRHFKERSPTLVLLSRDPFLRPIPSEVRTQARELVLGGSPDQISARAGRPSPDPLLLPEMALSAALRTGLFGKVLWIIPSSSPKEKLNVEIFRQQLLDFGAVTKEEADSFVADETAGRFSGKVRGVLFTAVPPDALPATDVPVVLHIDLSWFAPLYKGEIKTPLYPLIYKTLNTLRDAGMNTLAVTLSSANATGDLPLDTRFIGPDLAELFRTPRMLDAPFPEKWVKRSNALYLPNFFKREESRDLYLQLEQAEPEDPSIKFALYQTSRELKDGTKALDYLAQAVALDPIYGYEYLNLASVALEKKLPDQAVRMIGLARKALPDDPFVELRLDSLLIDGGHGDRALPSLEALAKLPWSRVYYPGMVKNLEAMLDAARNGKNPKL